MAGGLLGALTSIPTIVEFAKDPPECILEAFHPSEEPPENREQRALTLMAMLCSMELLYPASSVLTTSFVGSALGTLTGIVLVSRAQGLQGNLIWATAGVLVGEAASVYWMNRVLISDMREIRERIQEGEPPTQSLMIDASFMLGSLAFTLLPVLLGVLGFNLL
jgi:hypothetical protein